MSCNIIFSKPTLLNVSNPSSVFCAVLSYTLNMSTPRDGSPLLPHSFSRARSLFLSQGAPTTVPDWPTFCAKS
uniref:Uncharacterized protein n=1 Tax=Octopus bimaculoides TaxID=37653 RepID=A0A0L8HSK9_OCTBM